jgi:hypothetical protein
VSNRVYTISGVLVPPKLVPEFLRRFLEVKAAKLSAHKESWFSSLIRKYLQWRDISNIQEMCRENKCDASPISTGLDWLALEWADHLILVSAPRHCISLIREIAGEMGLVLTMTAMSRKLPSEMTLTKLYQRADCVRGAVVDGSGTYVCRNLVGLDGKPWSFRVEDDSIFLSGSPIAETYLKNVCLGLFSGIAVS